MKAISWIRREFEREYNAFSQGQKGAIWLQIFKPWDGFIFAFLFINQLGEHPPKNPIREITSPIKEPAVSLKSFGLLFPNKEQVKNDSIMEQMSLMSY